MHYDHTHIKRLLRHITAIVILSLFAINGYGQNQTTYNTPGTYTFKVPAGVTSITVECWGGGGGGSNKTSGGRGGGGGGGAYARSIIPVVPGSVYTIVVGAGGGGSLAGGNSSFHGSTVVAAGGMGGVNDSITAGAGGTASTGYISYAGGYGANGGSSFSGGGGGGAGSTGAGGNATNETAGKGTSLYGGDGGAGTDVQTNGNPGKDYGGGGGGAKKGGNKGGTGAGGQVIICYPGLGYKYESNITLNPASGSEDLTDFPALISITSSPHRDRLRTIANGGRLSNTNGYDVIFTDNNGNKLDHQLEHYDPSTGEYVAWVRIPLLSHSSSTSIKMMYGNPTVTTNPSISSVWTSNYMGVWHLNGSDFSDGTSNANNGTQSNTTDVTGRIAGGKSFNGTNSYVQVPVNGGVPNNNNQTISIWANYTSLPSTNQNLIVFQNEGAKSAIQLGFRGGDAVAWMWAGAVLVNGGSAPSVNTWHYYVYTFDGTRSRLYIDGVEKATSAVAPQTAMPTSGQIGRYYENGVGGEYVKANLDEPRFSVTPRPAGWIQTEYNNQNNPAGFITIGNEGFASLLAAVGVCSTSYTLAHGYPTGGSYSGPGVTGTNFNATAAGVGTHAISYSFTGGCNGMVTKNIIVTPVPSAPTASSKECCISNIADLEATGTNLRWYSDAGLTTLVGTGTPFATKKTAVGVYTYYVTQTVNGCRSTATTVSLTILNGVSITTQPQAVSICAGDNAVFSVGAKGYNLSYQWQRGTSNISNGSLYIGVNTSTLTVLSPTTELPNTFRCVISTACGSPVTVISNAVTLTVTARPVATFSYTGSQYCPNAGNPSPTFSGGGKAGTFSSTTGLVFISTATGQINISSSTPGIYTVTNTVPGSGACGPATATATVEIVSTISWNGSSDTNWNNTLNWTCGYIPTAKVSVNIPNVTNKPVLSTGSVAVINNLTLGSGASLTVMGNTLTINGSVSGSSSFNASAGTVVFAGTSAQTIPAGLFTSNTVMNLTASNSNGVSLIGPLNVSGIVRVTAGSLTSGGYLTLLSTASGTALIDGSGTGSVTGNVIMQRYLPLGFGYKYFSSPFQNATVSEFGDDMNLTYSFPLFYRYDENSVYSGWVSYVTGSGVLNPLEGYAVNFGGTSSPKTVDVTGIVNNGNLSVTLYNHNRAYTRGFNLVGNPYPSPINWNASGWSKTNIDNAIYYFRASTTDQYGGTYSSYVGGISSDGQATNIIPSMQGFFVHVANGMTGTLGVTNSVRITDQTHTFLKSGYAERGDIIRATAGFTDDTTSYDPLVIYFDNSADSTFDSMLDALKLYNTDMMVTNFYSVLADGQKLSINALPEQHDTLLTVPLGLNIYRDGEVKFKLLCNGNVPPDSRIYFRDASTGANINMVPSGEYKISLTAGEYNNRFSFSVFKNLTGIPDLEMTADIFTAYLSHGKIITEVYIVENNSGRIMVYDLTGKLQYVKNITESGIYDLDPSLHAGMYIIRYTTGWRHSTKKLIVGIR